MAERYSSREQYLGLFAEAALQAVRERSLLAEDLPAVIERGEEEWLEATR